MINWLRQKLGLDEILLGQRRLHEDSKHQNMLLSKLSIQIGTVTPGLGRVIAKLDPMYGKSEFDKDRKAESDKLGEEVIEKLAAEHYEWNKYK